MRCDGFRDLIGQGVVRVLCVPVCLATVAVKPFPARACGVCGFAPRCRVERESSTRGVVAVRASTLPRLPPLMYRATSVRCGVRSNVCRPCRGA